MAGQARRVTREEIHPSPLKRRPIKRSTDAPPRFDGQPIPPIPLVTGDSSQRDDSHPKEDEWQLWWPVLRGVRMSGLVDAVYFDGVAEALNVLMSSRYNFVTEEDVAQCRRVSEFVAHYLNEVPVDSIRVNFMESVGGRRFYSGIAFRENLATIKSDLTDSSPGNSGDLELPIIFEADLAVPSYSTAETQIQVEVIEKRARAIDRIRLATGQIAAWNAERDDAVASARQFEATWHEIAEVVGTSTQSAQRRWTPGSKAAAAKAQRTRRSNSTINSHLDDVG